MATKSISQLNTTVDVDNGTLFECATPDSGSASGYTSEKMSVAQLADHIANFVVYPNLDTTAQSLVGAINELCGTKLTDTLTAGNATLTISDNAILTTSVVDIYVDTWGVSPSDVEVTAGSITLTFPVQAGDVDVLVIVR